MKIIFIANGGLNSNSGMHIFHLANAIAAHGVECVAYIQGKAEEALAHGRPKFTVYSAFDCSPRSFAGRLAMEHSEYIIHCWTPREVSRNAAEPLAAVLDAPVIVHMEDNEEIVFKTHSSDWNLNPELEENWLPDARLYRLSHPARHKEFLARVHGYTCIINSLLEFKPPHIPGHIIWPSCEEAFFTLPPMSRPEDKIRLGIPPECPVLFYPGAMHPNNRQEILELYEAVCLLRQADMPIKIIKLGKYVTDVAQHFAAWGINDCLVDLTDKVKPAEIPRLMRAVDFLAQPGRDDAFNHYRFPCKLPMFLASGRPVLLPESNLGFMLTHGKNCLLLRNTDKPAIEICALLKMLMKNPALASSIGQAGRAFAREHFSWAKTANRLIPFYGDVLSDYKKHSEGRKRRGDNACP
ncbi:MAG: glycosyltransferase family 4 protein [Desulfovibrio sp.]|jgi:glycosyltransferase involved in cell wall biosynthesis|nr:glycosyltransferase family 4 protein [Desulfovibrio sp.]